MLTLFFESLSLNFVHYLFDLLIWPILSTCFHKKIKIKAHTLKVQQILCTLLLLVFTAQAQAQAQDKSKAKPVIAPNNSEVHLFNLTINNGNYLISNGKNITNNPGYDNQPFFTDDNEALLFVSNRDGKQTDVYEYKINSKKTVQLTSTSYNEYSPKSFNNSAISFVSEGGEPAQSVWKLDRASGKRSWLLNSKEPVGYYSANAQTGDVLFWSRYGWSVQYLNINKNESRFVSGNAIPSTPKRIPNSGNFSFVHRQANDEVWIKSFNPTTFSITPLARIDGSNYDYAWAPNGDILLVEQNRLFVFSPINTDSKWQLTQDLRPLFNGRISRLAISGDGNKIALVENLSND